MLTTATRPVTTSALRRRGVRQWRAAFSRLAHGAAGRGGAVPEAGAGASTEFVWGYAIRREWPDGSHDLFGFVPDKEKAERSLARDRSFWRDGPVRPVAVYLVPASAADVDRHPVDGCRASWCPDSLQRGESR